MSAEDASSPTAQVVHLTVCHTAAPVKRDRCLVRYDGRLFSFEDLLRHAPEAAYCAALETSPDDPQQWWDELKRRYPSDARRTAALCFSYGPAEPCEVVSLDQSRR